MTNQRASKRRRVSDVDEEGDTEMLDSNDASSSPSVKNEGSDDDAYTPTTPTRSTRRRTSRPSQKVAQDNEGETNAETPTKSGLRSSGRQRKQPQRFEQELKAPSSARKTAGTPKSTDRTPRSTRKTRQASEVEKEEENEEEQSPEPQPTTLARTRSKRATVNYNEDQDEERENTAQSGSPDEGDQDGIDDLVAMQLQQDLYPEQGGKDAVPPTELLPDYVENIQALAQGDNFQKELQVLTQVVLEKLNGKRQIPLKGLETEYQKVYHLVEQTVTSGEGNSMLLLGSRGCGKTAIVETVLSTLAKEHANDFHVVRLNGFLHTDDRLALREMWRQLGREMNTEEEAGKINSYADTMATLLALLSHPEELFGPGQADGMTAAKSIVILLDEFDLFVSHPRQTLLYNLFDIAQARKAPVAVIGSTTKVDVTEMLEKRVKSRFSHRYVFVPLPRTFEMFSEICFAGLNLEDGELAGYYGSGAKAERWRKLLGGWRTYLEALWNDENFRSHLMRIYNQTKSVKEFFTSALLAMTELHHSTYTSPPEDLTIPTPKTFANEPLTCPDPAPLPFQPSTTASSPSSLPLSLLLAATRLTALYDPGNDAAAQPQSLAPLALSFPAAYAEYARLLTSAKVSASVSGATATAGRVWGRDVAREAWEKLVSWGLVNPVGGGSGTADGRMFRVEVSFEEVVEMAGSGGSLGRWWRDG
ncbi:origin recognition complex subunit 4 [Aspergillus chevalieri]|uniref:Origin recognition complex subunit 4 n=1 Tax=Aspergillus chevalieri TaxID=182096 RepID=A0A7R7ZN08_ASPCH|nr:uncharacterized protein ACHE_40632S [Aspergillus chevalieri]BCR88068.1 hypothetical protein ACHE_40632S [Aspergillus chevalieri]